MPEPVDRASYKAALRRFATGVTVITCRDGGQDHAMTASAFSAVSLEPPLVLVCVSRTARFHSAISTAGSWGVSVLDLAGESAARWLSTPGRPLAHQLDTVPHHRGSSGVALLDDALACLECRTMQTVAAGDHTVFIGEVLSASVTDRDAPLLHWESQYRQVRE